MSLVLSVIPCIVSITAFELSALQHFFYSRLVGEQKQMKNIMLDNLSLVHLCNSAKQL